MADTILPHELPTALETRAGVRLLSLDCFDTLLWRDTHAPRDIFRLLSGTTPQQRMWAETRARRSALLRHSRNEVSIEEIYAELLPNADAATRAAAVDAEIDAEARHCFAFGPTVALMKAARERGIKTVIVSDTYLSGKQLRELIRRAAGDEVAGLIDTIFASSEHKLSKKEGLLGTMLRKTSVKPERVLHIGDNCAADHDAARRHGIPALHLRQFTDGCAQRLRLEAATGAMVDAGGAVFQPHRATLAAGAHRIEDAAEALGHNVLGPVLVPFANWLEQEAEALAATNGGRVHMLFLMRDGHLPRRIHEAAFPARAGHAIELSRFTATAASFRDEAAVHDYVEAELGNGTPEDLLRQLLFPPNEIAEIIEALPETAQLGALAKTVCAPRHIKAIVKRSQAFAERLATYLRRECDPQPGDTLLLADLGYNGTVQNHAEPVLRALLGVHVAGRYLLLREQAATGFDKRGFMDGSTHDADTLEAFAANVAVLEQLCTAAQGSVIDYSDDGSPVRAGNSIKGRQSETRERAQRGAIAFARDHAQAIIRTNDSARAECERSGAAAALARLMFLPSEAVRPGDRQGGTRAARALLPEGRRSHVSSRRAARARPAAQPDSARATPLWHGPALRGLLRSRHRRSDPARGRPRRGGIEHPRDTDAQWPLSRDDPRRGGTICRRPPVRQTLRMAADRLGGIRAGGGLPGGETVGHAADRGDADAGGHGAGRAAPLSMHRRRFLPDGAAAHQFRGTGDARRRLSPARRARACLQSRSDCGDRSRTRAMNCLRGGASVNLLRATAAAHSFL